MTEVDLSELIVGDTTEWLSALPTYQRSTLVSLLKTNDALETATIWLANTGPRDTAPFGGMRTAASNFYNNILREMQKVLCDGPEYAEERKQLVAATQGGGKLMLVSAISAIIAPHVGAAAVVIGPAVALTLAVLGNAGKATVCEAVSDLVASRETKGVLDVSNRDEPPTA